MNGLRRWCTAATTIAAVVATVAPARASAPVEALRLSIDGVNWASSIDVPLFDPDHRWVPGDRATVELWAENDTSDPASLTVDLVGTAEPSLLDLPGASLTAAVGGTSRTVLTHDEARLVDLARVDPAARTRVTLTFALDASAGNDTQRAVADVRLIVTLAQVDDTEPPPTPPTTVPAPTTPPASSSSPGSAAPVSPPTDATRLPGTTVPVDHGEPAPPVEPSSVVPPAPPAPTAAALRPPGPIPRTGSAITRPLAAGAAAVLLAGVGLALRGRRAS